MNRPHRRRRSRRSRWRPAAGATGSHDNAVCQLVASLAAGDALRYGVPERPIGEAVCACTARVKGLEGFFYAY
jgi:hypothetical protein